MSSSQAGKNPPPAATGQNSDIDKSEARFYARTDLQALAAQQGVAPITDWDALRGDFWPEQESADEFIGTVRRWRHEATNRKAR